MSMEQVIEMKQRRRGCWIGYRGWGRMQLPKFRMGSLRCSWISQIVVILLVGLLVSNCVNPMSFNGNSQSTASANLAANGSTADLLRQSWQSYRERFIQGDGRVIDREDGDRTTSEAQAYALLRAVLIDDPATFDRVLEWSETNLQRRKLDGTQRDRLWAWKWGKDEQGNWSLLDGNFASDGDIDAVTALILGARRWNRSNYLELARAKLNDLWDLATLSLEPGTGSKSGGSPTAAAAGSIARYLLPGPLDAFQPQPNQVYLNPSYFAPYAFRLFAQIDTNHNWQSLVDSSYQLLEQSDSISAIGLPSDWVILDRTSGSLQPANAAPLQSIYGFDAYRVWWRVALDSAWFNEPRARSYLQQHLVPLKNLWQSQRAIPAQLDRQGKAIVTYEATAQYAMLYTAFRLTDPGIADQIYQQKLLPAYQNGFWDNDSAYYAQNLSWFGLFPAPEVAANWLRP